MEQTDTGNCLWKDTIDPEDQRQFLDRETGLHYTTILSGIIIRFRRFMQPDPIGLRGGYNLYQYAPNALIWVYPYGLICIINSN